MKQAVFREVRVRRRERPGTQRHDACTSPKRRRRCTPTVGVLRTGPGFSASCKPDCAKLRKPGDPSDSAGGTVRTDRRPSRWPLVHRSCDTQIACAGMRNDGRFLARRPAHGSPCEHAPASATTTPRRLHASTRIHSHEARGRPARPAAATRRERRTREERPAGPPHRGFANTRRK